MRSTATQRVGTAPHSANSWPPPFCSWPRGSKSCSHLGAERFSALGLSTLNFESRRNDAASRMLQNVHIRLKRKLMIVHELDLNRVLKVRQAEKMARSPHAFVRGNTVQHYEWLAGSGARLPEGPPVWICGDCHVGNLGPIADAEGRIDVQIRDLDQTVIGNPAHDLIRLALSLASAARGSNLPGTTTADMIEKMVEGYEAGLSVLDDENPIPEPAAVATVRRQALGRKWRHLARERIRDVKPSIPRGDKFRDLDDKTRWNIGVLLDSERVKPLIVSLGRRDGDARIELLDAAYWIKGCSSLGKLRYAALVRVSGKKKDRMALVDIKEAVASAAPAMKDAGMPGDNAERVVAGARALSPNLGDRMAPCEISDKPVVVRELLPEDLKLDLEQFTRKEAVESAKYLASVVGIAHGRQLQADDRRAWLKELTGRHPPDLAAPSWLWNTVVDLLGKHEAAYLQHCRSTLSLAA